MREIVRSILERNLGDSRSLHDKIAAIKTLMTSVLPYDPHPYLHKGMQVEVVRGPLRGVQGILLRKEKRHRLVIGVRLIQQAAAVEIDIQDV